MTTTFEQYKGSRRANYCTLPTQDVEILPNTYHCQTCGGEVYPEQVSWRVEWRHLDLDVSDHHPSSSPRTRCTYCHTDDPTEVAFFQAAYSDETRCTRCGGVNGYGIGD